jgi:anti-anti-sigma regulatory factor
MKQRKAARKTGSNPRTARAIPTAAASKRKAVRPLALPVECGIAMVEELKSGLLKRVSDSGSVRIDASAVQRIDTASLQVLAAFARDRRVAGLPVAWVGVSDVVTDAAGMLDLTETLGLAPSASAVPA